MEHIEFTDLMELADMITERLDNPITIEDMNHHVVAYSTHGETTDPVRMETIMRRKVPEAVLVRFWKDGVIQSLMHSDEPVRIPAMKDVGLNDRVAISIRRGQEILGYIWVQEAVRPLTEHDFSILKWAARLAMPRMLHRKDRQTKNEEKRQQFFWEVLSGGTAERREIEKRAAQLQVYLPPVMEVLVFEFRSSGEVWHSLQKELDYLFSNLGDFFPVRYIPMWVFDENQFIILAGMNGDEEEKMHEASKTFVGQLHKRLNRRFGKESMIAGHGQPVRDVTKIAVSYQQGLEVIHLKKALPEELGEVQGYHELGMYRLFPEMKKWNEKMNYTNTKLERLLAYDRENQSNLVDTLEAFLATTGKINQTIQRLHIHPNTLSYRLKRITEVGGVDLNDPNDRVMLFLDLKMRKYK
ncbi:PucR family transcriptional regulator [Aneurinibacillus tyrosinisolvens]|uniref:PucR family transcriptional regulator n=1 Tax=Aneurinibacillus tyrosinisolvens TaxID=1443435 RepID=UPI00063F0204|nr:helix-turn-helix domain-containing protein [Aneurinibacillus tyrosinisolvens]